MSNFSAPSAAAAAAAAAASAQGEKPTYSQDLLELLRELSPDITVPQIRTKLDCTLEVPDSLFRFLRAFVAYYHYQYCNNRTTFASILGEKYHAIEGYCVGDAHPENFGILVNSTNEIHFSMNDLDDSGRGYIAADALRFFTACMIGVSSVDLSAVVEAYTAGVLGGSAPECKAVQKMLKDAAKEFENGAPLPKLKKIELSKKKGHIKGLVADPNIPALSADEKTQFEQAFVAAYCPSRGLDKDDVFDAVAEERLQGGSGGLLRFLTVGRAKGKENEEDIMLIEFKQIARPGIFPYHLEDRPANLRLAQTMSYEVAGGYHPWYKVRMPSATDIGFLAVPYLMRPRFDALEGIDLTKVEASDLASIVMFEAFTLGCIHRNSDMMDAPASNDAWIDAVSNISTASWIAAATVMTNVFRGACNMTPFST
jgi:hypothetical protein